MNKKLVLLVVPLLLVPLVATGYAHFTDQVVKKYKIHVGSVYLNVTGFHVDYCKMPDVDNDGVIFGDELNITIYESPDCRWYVLIEANPVTGGFVLNTTLWMHNGGKLPFELMWDVGWDGPYPEDPCFDIPPGKSIADLPMPPWSFEIVLYKWHLVDGEYVRDGPFKPTQTDYKPCDYIEVKQHVNFEQPDPALNQTWQKDWQCRWIKIWETFTAQDIYVEASSWQWGRLGPGPTEPPM